MLYTENYYKNIGLGSIYASVMENERLTEEDGLLLFETHDIQAIGALAHHVRVRKHRNNTYYVLNRHINYSNICVHSCVFCAFKRPHEHSEGAFIYSHKEIMEQLSVDATPFTEIHIVGGCHPTLSLDWFTELVRAIHCAIPNAGIKIFTAVEIAHLAQQEGVSIQEVLLRLKEAGASMLTGGGAEIFAPSIRKQICPSKLTADEWLHVHGVAHSIGYKTNCTMLFGHIERYEDRVSHLCALRAQQDITKGFTCFIPLPYQHKNNPLAGKVSPTADSYLDKLKTIAISRLLLDNIPHIKAYWIMLGVKEAQTALFFGANDLDGTIVEEKIGHWAGAKSVSALTIVELEHMIQESGFVPICRDASFTAVGKQGDSTC